MSQPYLDVSFVTNSQNYPHKIIPTQTVGALLNTLVVLLSLIRIQHGVIV